MTTNKTGTLNMIIQTLSISAVALLLAMAAQAQIDNFHKAFSACLEGKNYIVKY